MSATAKNGHTIRLHRVLRAPPERVYKAFTDAEALAKWLPPYGFTCKVDHLEAKVGGTFRMSFTSFASGKSHFFGGEYLELTPHERLRYTDRFDDPNLPGEIQVTVALKKVSCGTEMKHYTGRCPQRHPGRVLLSGLAGIAGAAREARRGRNSRLEHVAMRRDPYATKGDRSARAHRG
jgi:uncharacterized protein YndB with AHSA1/START domain